LFLHNRYSTQEPVYNKFKFRDLQLKIVSTGAIIAASKNTATLACHSEPSEANFKWANNRVCLRVITAPLLGASCHDKQSGNFVKGIFYVQIQHLWRARKTGRLFYISSR
jgi:hypothetical protein